ncbi:hypothetical protein EVAR_91125_1 [Eumeta japonica]|uniref:Uncharacterized protein n=1 Tax=Eumeta variegata TaxID=151549 RepID=A0A4C1SDC8_EUMVA|nr:hypothetical protein EVAR_91125_1 [Eumeta japonica]
MGLINQRLLDSYLKATADSTCPPPQCTDAGWFQGGEVWPGARLGLVSVDDIPVGRGRLQWFRQSRMSLRRFFDPAARKPWPTHSRLEGATQPVVEGEGVDKAVSDTLEDSQSDQSLIEGSSMGWTSWMMMMMMFFWSLIRRTPPSSITIPTLQIDEGLAAKGYKLLYYRHSDGDTVTTMIEEEGQRCGSYPVIWHDQEPPPGTMVAKAENAARMKGIPYIIGADANAHHQLWVVWTRTEEVRIL